MFKKQREKRGVGGETLKLIHMAGMVVFFLHKPRSDHIIDYMSVYDQPLKI